MDRDLHKTYVTLYPYYMLLVERFMVGIHKLMGGKVNQDKIVWLEVVHKLVEGLEEKFRGENKKGIRESIVDIAVFSMVF